MKKTKKYNGQQNLAVDNKNSAKKTIIASKAYTGPIPTAEEFARYKEVMPDMPERILKVFEEDSKHIRDINDKSIDGAISFDRRSQWMAFIIILVGLIGTFVLAYLNKDIASIVTGLGTAALIFKGTFAHKS